MWRLAKTDSYCAAYALVAIMTTLFLFGCATSPQERAEKSCEKESDRTECISKSLRIERLYDLCRAAAQSLLRRYEFEVGQTCRTSGTVDGRSIDTVTKCSPDVVSCNDLLPMEMAFSRCVANENPSISDALIHRYKLSNVFYLAANNIGHCPVQRPLTK
jgi:hypothetical protein